MTRVIVTALISCGITAAVGYLLLPVLRALKAGQSIREVGPTWHNSKAGTPMMGGLMFIISAVLCLLISIAVLAFLYLNKELFRPRCTWMTFAAAAIVLLVLLSLILNFPSPKPLAMPQAAAFVMQYWI